MAQHLYNMLSHNKMLNPSDLHRIDDEFRRSLKPIRCFLYDDNLDKFNE